MYDKLLQETEKVGKESLLNEDFKSQRLGELQKVAGRRWNSLISRLHKGSYGRYGSSPQGGMPEQWSEIPDEEVLQITPEEAYGAAYKDYLLFWLTDVERSQRDYDFLNWDVQPGLIALSTGKVISSDISKDFGSTSEISKPSGKKIASLATKVYAISPDTLAKYSAKDMQTARAEQQKGATALQKPEDIKKENKRRYEELLQAKHADLDVKEAAKQLFDLANAKLDAALQAGEVSKYGDLVVPGMTDRRGEPLKVESLAQAMQTIWRGIGRLTRNEQQIAQDPEGYNTYAKRENAEFKNELRRVLDQITAGRLDTW